MVAVKFTISAEKSACATDAAQARRTIKPDPKIFLNAMPSMSPRFSGYFCFIPPMLPISNFV